jgi:Protein of unknown function (DUF3631)
MKGLSSEAIIAELVKKPDRPWADWKSGKAITPKALAGLLKPFGLFPHQLSVGDGKELRGMRDKLSQTHSPATYPLFNVSMCRKPHSRSHKCLLFNVSANPLTDTLRKRGK